MAVTMSNEDVKNPEQMDALFKAGAHFAFSRSRRHPSMAPFIFGVKNKVEIFDLEKVADMLEETKEHMKKLGTERKKILFVSGKNEAREVVKNAAISISMPYVAGRWIGGTLTNFPEIKKRISRMIDLSEKREKGELSKFTKLERLYIDREIEDLEDTFGGLRGMEALPHAMFVVDTRHEEIAVAEAKKMGIPVIGILNSDCNANNADHFIPGNDSSVASITYFIQELVGAYQEGLKSAPAPKETSKEAPKKAERTGEKNKT